MRKIIEILTKANDTVLDISIADQLDLYLELESLSNRVGANLLQFQLENPEFKDTIKSIKESAQEAEETGQGYKEYSEALNSFRKDIEAKRARLAEEQAKKESIAKLIELFKSLDLNKSLTEIYSELDSEYEELRDLVADLYMLVHEETEDIDKEIAAVEEQQRYYTAHLYKTELS